MNEEDRTLRAVLVGMLRDADDPRTNESSHLRWGDMDERREVVYGLSGDEARECLAQMFEEGLQHQASHGTETAETVQHAITEILRSMAYHYSDQEAREQVLNKLNERDEHWRAEHPEEPEPGTRHLIELVNDVRRASGPGE